MTIEVFTICYNEEKMLPFFLNHYSSFCDKITIFDNQSTDKTKDLLERFDKCLIDHRMYDTGNTLNDSVYLEIKNNCWKTSKSDYVIVVDCDEFLYHTNLKQYLCDNPHTIYKPTGYDMVCDTFPEGSNILDIKTGVRSPNYDKLVIFSPSKIGDINYLLGCHQAIPLDITRQNVTPQLSDELKLLHYKNLSFEYRYQKHVAYLNRLSSFNKDTGSGIHYTFDENTQFSEFSKLQQQATNII